jgi:Zn-dependent protease with chaperone function
MLAKPFKLILVYILTVINITFLIAPIIASIAPFTDFTRNGIVIDYNIYQKTILIVNSAIFAVSFVMLCYIFFDFLFGFSHRSSLKNCKRYDKLKGYEFLNQIFLEAKEKFNSPNVKLYIKNSDEINAYAVASMYQSSIVLTRGLIDHYLVLSADPKEFLLSIRSIIGHEMSHLINRDFLPTFFVICNQKATNLVSNIVHKIFYFKINFFQKVPYIGLLYANAVYYLFSLMNFILTIFNKYIVLVIYNFLNKFASRSIEYRCDLQSAQAFGGDHMATALEKLGKNGYFKIFSTHPNTSLRIKNVRIIKPVLEKISPSFSNKLSNYLAMMTLVTICLYFAKQANIDQLVRELLRNHEYIYRKLSYLWHLFKQIY